MMVYKGNGMLS